MAEDATSTTNSKSVHDQEERPVMDPAARTLQGEGLVEYYQFQSFHRHQEESLVAVAVIQIGNQLCGPLGIVHGGVISLLYQDVFSMAGESLLSGPTLAEHLKVVYKQPQPVDEFVQIRVYLDKPPAAKNYNSHSSSRDKRRRIFLRATCRGLGAAAVDAAPIPTSEDGILYSSATSTIVQARTATVAEHDTSILGHSNTGKKNKHENMPTLTSRL